MDMLVGTTGARYSKSLEQCCQRTACFWGRLNVKCAFTCKVRAVDIKRGCVGRFEERLAQQESGAALSKSSICIFPGSNYTRCALIRTDDLLYTCS